MEHFNKNENDKLLKKFSEHNFFFGQKTLKS